RLTWGTLQTTTSGHPSLHAIIDRKTSRDSQTDIIVGSPQGEASNRPPPLYPSSSSSSSSLGSAEEFEFQQQCSENQER
ncbi:hypothetical protein BYT27DRAFT_7205832, partial [Phlegmacium glaucopus]